MLWPTEGVPEPRDEPSGAGQVLVYHVGGRGAGYCEREGDGLEGAIYDVEVGEIVGGEEGGAEDGVEEAVEVRVCVHGVLSAEERAAGAGREGGGRKHGFHLARTSTLTLGEDNY